MSSREEVYRAVRRKLLEGTIHSHRDLARNRLASVLKASTGVVQWVLTQLEAEKVLEIRPQSGTFVRRLDFEEFQHLCDIRELLEPHAAAQAARFITSRQLEQLERIWQKMADFQEELKKSERTSLPSDYSERDARLEHEFHGTILEAARNPELAHIVENMVIPIVVYEHSLILEWPLPDAIKNGDLGLEAHKGILDALRQGHSGLAQRRMRHHLRSGFLFKGGKRIVVPPGKGGH
jgi:DNA-binding GntR family transcriptional regulator